MKPIKLLTILSLILAAAAAYGAPLRTYVANFNVVGTQNAAELKQLFPTLFASRLPEETFQQVTKREDAEVEISGSYAIFGKKFSLDAAVKNMDGKTLAKGFEEGGTEEEIPAAVGKLAAKLGKTVDAASIAKPVETKPLPAAPVAAPLIPLPVTVPAAKETWKAPVSAASENLSNDTWGSQPLNGEMVAMAVGRKLASGEREIFLADQREVFCYRTTKDELTLVTSVKLPASSSIIALDAADTAADGTLEIFVTAMDRGYLASQIYKVAGDRLIKTGDALPYYFRVLDIDGKATLYGQQSSMESDFYGNISAMVRTAKGYESGSEIKTPAGGNIYNLLPLKTARKPVFAILTSDGRLAAIAENGEQLWISSEKYGGLETNFKRETEQARITVGDGYRWVYLQPRIFTTKEGTLLLVKNDGALTVGTIRSYNRHSFHMLKWTGSAFREEYNGRTTPGYLADYWYEKGTGEITTLEVTQKEGMFAKGKSVVNVLKMGN